MKKLELNQMENLLAGTCQEQNDYGAGLMIGGGLLGFASMGAGFLVMGIGWGLALAAENGYCY
jgi:hypothetical protein|tara:strand:+ start:242 stop:430 length:189 start_codon:yes stop_codon:yes gene_type:complete